MRATYATSPIAAMGRSYLGFMQERACERSLKPAPVRPALRQTWP